MTYEETLLKAALVSLRQAATLLRAAPSASHASAATASAIASAQDALQLLHDDGVLELARLTAIVALHYQAQKD